MPGQNSALPVRANISSSMQHVTKRMSDDFMRMTVDSLLPRTRQLLDWMHEQVMRAKRPPTQVRFSQKYLQENFGWTRDLRRDLAVLVSLEFVADHDQEFELLYQGEKQNEITFPPCPNDSSPFAARPSHE